MMRLLIAALAALLLATVGSPALASASTTSQAPPAAASANTRATSAEQVLFDLLNDVRAEHGLEALQRDQLLDQIALEWTQGMAPQGSLSHRGDLRAQVEQRVTTQWMRIGENVGWGPSAEWLHQAFFNSPPHRANMLGEYNRVGIGALLEPDGDLWVTVNFLDGPDLAQVTPPEPSPVEATPAAAWAVNPSGVV
ncbi:MAG: CAP domain-containing protein, partial [Acidimicrobiales bacterium]|nr:CAP domain-containing protein [Acidimicrobiales bacterium]